MTEQHTLTLDGEAMRKLGYQMIDAVVAHHLRQSEKLPVSTATRAEMDALLLEDAPEHPTDPQKTMQFIVDEVLPKSTLLSHPKSFAFVPGPSNYVSVIGDALATGYNVFSGSWVSSPVAAGLEIATIQWLLQWFGFPKKKGGGIFTSGGSMANLTALAMARNMKCGNDFSKAIIYLSDQTHSSNIKAIRILGFQKEQIRIIPTDSDMRLSLNKLKNCIAKDRLNGDLPFCLIGNAGTTNTGSVDPLPAMAALCKKEDLWFHIDGAYGGAAVLSPQGKAALKGISKADSLTVDPHKWLFQPYEMGCLLVRNYKHLSHTFTERPEYLKDIEGNDSEINFYDMGVQLTRRFNALKFYMSVKTFGLKAFREAVGSGIALAEQLEQHLRKSKHWEVVFPATLAVINFRYNPMDQGLSEAAIDQLNQTISDKVMASQQALLATTLLHDQVVLRMCLINPRTTFDDVTTILTLCEGFAEEAL
ncbi:MAG: aminotransferase class V-fold PLP-dependent enzyme [Bacteroidota bacterium]